MVIVHPIAVVFSFKVGPIVISVDIGLPIPVLVFHPLPPRHRPEIQPKSNHHPPGQNYEVKGLPSSLLSVT